MGMGLRRRGCADHHGPQQLGAAAADEAGAGGGGAVGAGDCTYVRGG
eukprot:CAMPEP_0173305632 /NCGR_PEP_ID=MMETSP1143-20121109/20114_1 /TAXON_ID=483371 /ORGANISM="non described non described, Strain CCMP2298" /LENGTH=46 /DNA_ID= /DNA_START= /DNA_END= /DNA_ORIENTATION=